MWSVSNAFTAQLKHGRRTVRFAAQMFNKNFEPMGTRLELEEGGNVTYETGSPSGRASFTLLDPNGNLPSEDDPIWFARNIGIAVEMLVAGEWEEVPLFLGPVQNVARQGIRVSVNCDSKEVQHIAPHYAPRPISIRKHTKIHRAIREILADRGETNFNLDHVRQRLPKNRLLNVGVEPWKVCRSLARDAEMQLMYRGNGTVRLRDWPSVPSWRFVDGVNSTLVSYPETGLSIGSVIDTVVVIGERTERVTVTYTGELEEKAVAGATSIKVAVNPRFVNHLADGERITIGRGDNAETRTISGTYTSGSRTIPLVRALDTSKAVGAPVKIDVREDRERPVVAQESLTQNHRLSSQSLTGGQRPRVEILERPSIHKRERAEELAQQRIRRVGGQFEQSIAISTVPIWHLERGDLFVVNFRGTEHRSRIQRISFPLSLTDTMEINWTGDRPPPKRLRWRKKRGGR